jgi:site-specific recombinase XerD
MQTHLLENGVDIRYIQSLLGNAKRNNDDIHMLKEKI